MPSEKENAKNKREFKFLPLTIGLETLGGIFSPLILRGTPLPATRHKSFFTAQDNQEAVDINIYIGERPFAGKNMKLAHVELKGLSKGQKGSIEITLKIIINKNLSLYAEVFESKSGAKESVNSEKSSTQLTQEKIEHLLKEAEENKDNDQIELRSIEDEIRVKQLIDKAENILNDKLNNKLYDSEKIEKVLAEIGFAMESEQTEKISIKANELESLIKPRNQSADFADIFSSFNSIFTSPKARQTRTKQSSKTSPDDPRKLNKKNEYYRDDRPTVEAIRYDIGKIFGKYDFTLDPNLCFVLMPFSKELEVIYNDHIKPTVESENITCQRADDITGTNLITYDIWEKISRARFMIADLTGKNPNVFYEIGLSHAIGKDVILITQSIDDVPFDLKAIRCIVYEFTPRGIKQFENRLIKTIQNIMSSS